jgi:hypothetical protein
LQKYSNGTAVVIGEKLENPYSVDNMKKDLEELRKLDKNQRFADVEITPTDYYVRIRVSSVDQYDTLLSQGIHLFEYPLDVEILEDGNYYLTNDEDLNKGKWYYTSVGIDFNFMDLEFEVLEELYLEPDAEDVASSYY